MTLRPIGVFALLLLLLGPAGAQEQSSYIGLVYPPLPHGCEAKGRSSLANDEGTLEARQVNCAGIEMLWLTEIFNQQASPGHRRVIDAIPLRFLQGETEQVWIDGWCQYKDDPAAYTFAIGGHWEEGEYSNPSINGPWVKNTGVTHAWVVKPNAKRFESVPPEKVTCGYYENRD